MNLNLIGLETVKKQLGITDPANDAEISAMIPIVSADVRRILNNRYDHYLMACYTVGDSDLNLYEPGATQFNKAHTRPGSLVMGQVITGGGIPDDTYLTTQSPETGIYTMSAVPTANGAYVTPTITIAQWPAISKMIWYKISKANKASSFDETVTSKSAGPLSVSFGSGIVNKKWGYPQSLIDDLGYRSAKVG